MINNNFGFVAVSGYGWTGSGALVDMLKEVDSFGDIGTEFRLIKDPYGILNLQFHLVENWNPLTSDIAVKDFLWLTNRLSRPSIFRTRFGMNYSELISDRIEQITNEYVRAITDFEYLGTSLVLDMRKRWDLYLLGKLRNKFHRNLGEPMRFCRPSLQKFLEETRAYLRTLFQDYAEKKRLRTLVLDQAIPLPDYARATDLFDDIKLIIVDRDPRDVYAEIKWRRVLIGPELQKSGVEKFIDWYKQQRVDSSPKYSLGNQEKRRILRIRFEELVCNYNETKERVFNFLGGDIVHAAKRRYFIPEKSRNNIGLWRTLCQKNETNLISEKLSEYCFH